MSAYFPKGMRDLIRQQAGNRCGYCLSPQHLVMGMLEIEHIVPQAAGGSDEESNLWLACRLCNSYKSDQMQAVDPLTGNYSTSFIPDGKNGATIFNGTKEVRTYWEKHLVVGQLLSLCNSIT